MPVHMWKSPSTVNTILPGVQSDPDLVALSDGGYVVVWIDNDNIIGRYYNADGPPRTGEIVMADAADPLTTPDVAVHQDGTVFLIYNINDAGADTNAIAAFDTNGTLLSAAPDTTGSTAAATTMCWTAAPGLTRWSAATATTR